MPRWLKITGIGCGGVAALTLAGVEVLFFIAVVLELTREPVEQQGIEQEEPATLTEDLESEGERQEPDPAPPPPDTATIVLSGDAAYSCNIGSLDESRSVEGVGPGEYEVAVDTSPFDYESISVFCTKSDPGTLTAQIVYDGQVRQESTTSAEHGTLNIRWSPQN